MTAPALERITLAEEVAQLRYELAWMLKQRNELAARCKILEKVMRAAKGVEEDLECRNPDWPDCKCLACELSTALELVGDLPAV